MFGQETWCWSVLDKRERCVERHMYSVDSGDIPDQSDQLLVTQPVLYITGLLVPRVRENVYMKSYHSSTSRKKQSTVLATTTAKTKGDIMKTQVAMLSLPEPCGGSKETRAGRVSHVVRGQAWWK